MIATVTLNPALDLFLECAQIEFDTVLRTEAQVRAAGGKGINVSRMLNTLGAKTRAFVMVGGGTGREFISHARSIGFPVDYQDTAVPTRINVVVRESSTGRHVKINMPGGTTDQRFFTGFKRLLERHLASLHGLVLAGSLPPGLAPTTYADLVRMAHRVQLPVFLDAHGPALARALPEKPTVLKINREELEAILEHPVPSTAEIIEAAKHYHSRGVELVCITLGREGAVMVDETGVWRSEPPAASPDRAVGAGDCFLAGLVSKYLAGVRGKALLAHAMACGTARAMRSNQHAVERAAVDRLELAVRVEQGG
ncbi:1-phosphofructokinase family hexose kinase [Candidatus Poribacteria bacterium]|nr:1-phosphofructokinase family hexose kinase [Candidatus Poribacteria bacterium]